MAITLYSFWRSSAAYRARIALALKGLEYDYVSIDLSDDSQREGDYSTVNPQRKVPTLVHDGFVLPQTLSIVEYLEELQPDPSLFPKDRQDRALSRAMAEMIACDIHPLNNSSVLKFMRRDLGVEKSALSTWYHHWLTEGFAGVEGLLARHQKSGPLAFGQQPTIFEIFLVPQIVNARLWEFPLDPYPRIVAIDAACRELDAFTETAPPRQPDAPPGVEL